MTDTQPAFADIAEHWAYPFIRRLRLRGVIGGFPDGTFRPEQTMTRAEFAAILDAAFPRVPRRDYIPFPDVSADFWAAEAIRNAFEAQFISGFPEGDFRPGENISRLHVLLSLVSGLQMPAGESLSLTAIYNDGADIADYARSAIAIATRNRLVVNAPSIDVFNPNRPATRGEVAAFIYQALVYLQNSDRIASPYIVELATPGMIRRGTHLSVNGRTWRAPWGQWSSGISTYTGVGDKGAMLVLGMDLISSDATNLQAVKWFSTPLKPHRVKTEFDGEYRYINLDEIAAGANWEMVVDESTLRIFSTPADVETIIFEEDGNISRVEIELSRATPWELYERSGEWEIVADAIAPQSLADRFPETLPNPTTPDEEEQQNEGETAASSDKPSRPVVRISDTQTVIRGTLPDGYRVATKTRNTPDRIIVELRRDALVERDIRWTPGLHWRQQYLTLEGDRFPALWLTVRPNSGLIMRPIWTEKTRMKGTASLSEIVATWESMAAINGGYFNRNNLLPLGAIRRGGTWYSGPILNRGAIAWDDAGGVKMARLKLLETVATSQGRQFDIDLLNTGYVKAGIARYTPDWGEDYKPLTLNEILIVVEGDRVARQIEATDDKTPISIPQNGYLLTLRSFRSALEAFAVGSRVTVTPATTPSDFNDFPNILGAGPLLVQNHRIVLDAEAEGFNYWFGKQLAIRSAIAFLSSGELAIVTVHNRVGGAGPDLMEMAQLMQQLGAIDALNLDGGSSTSLVLGGHLLNRTPDTAARVHNGLGIFVNS